MNQLEALNSLLREACDHLQEERDEVFNSNQTGGAIRATDQFSAAAAERVASIDDLIKRAGIAINAVPDTAGSTDKARLDFLDECNRRLNARYQTTYGWAMVMNHNVNRLMTGRHLDVDLNDSKAHGHKSCRDAIDAEMQRVERARAATLQGPADA